MDLYLIRNAEAVAADQEVFTEDAKRALTDKGREHAKQLAGLLQGRGTRLEMILTSPLVRAQQTAKAIQESWKAPTPLLRTNEELAPGSRPRRLTRLLLDLRLKAVALVGHKNDLTTYTGWLIGSKKACIRLSKGGVAHIVFSDEPCKGGGTLVELFSPEGPGG